MKSFAILKTENVGIVTKFVLRNGVTDTVLSDSFIIAGGTGAGLMILLFLIMWCLEKRKKAKVSQVIMIIYFTRK